MVRYTEEQRVFIVQQYFKNNEALAATVRNFRSKYGPNSDLTSSTVKRLIQKFKETGSVSDLKHTGRPPTSRSIQNIEAVRESVAECPGTSIRHRGQELNISRSSLQRILAKDLHLTEISKKAGELWRELNDKSKWEQLAAKEGLRCAKEMRDCMDSGGAIVAESGHKGRKGVKRKQKSPMKTSVDASSGSSHSKEHISDVNLSSEELRCTDGIKERKASDGATKGKSGNGRRKGVKRKQESPTKKIVKITSGPLNSKHISDVNSSSDSSAGDEQKSMTDSKGKSASEVENDDVLSSKSDDEKAFKIRTDVLVGFEEEKSKSRSLTLKNKQTSGGEEDKKEPPGGFEEEGKKAGETLESSPKSKPPE